MKYRKGKSEIKKYILKDYKNKQMYVKLIHKRYLFLILQIFDIFNIDISNNGLIINNLFNFYD